MLLQDLRYAARLLRRAPLFTLTVVATLMLGIGATTTIFSVVNAVILTPLPFTASDRLVQVAEKNDRLGLPTFSSSAANDLAWKARAHAFEAIGAFGFGSYNLTGDGGEPEQINGAPAVGLISQRRPAAAERGAPRRVLDGGARDRGGRRLRHPGLFGEPAQA